jgi:hypothetical protein
VGWTCSVCGELHEEAMRDVRLGLPDPVFTLDESQREQQTRRSDDACVFVDEAQAVHHFVRGVLHLPVTGTDEDFRFGVWVEVDGADYDRLGRLWDDSDGSTSRPFFGTLANELAPYETAAGLPVAVQLRDVHVLPGVIVLDAEHALGRDQRIGISEAHANRLAETVLH